VVDPDAAQLAHKVGIGQNIQLQLGHQIDQKWGEPVFLGGVVVRLSDGEFNYRGGIWDGRVGCMGLTAVVEVDSIQIVVSSNATYDWMTEQFDLVGLDIVNSKFIVVKNPMNYQQAYEGIMKAAFVLDTPGPTPANTNALEYSKFKNDWFPSEADLEVEEPIVLVSKRRNLAKI
jgi:microcystin degradation protein MlrC